MPTALEAQIYRTPGAGGGGGDRLATAFEQFLIEQRGKATVVHAHLSLDGREITTSVNRTNRDDAVTGFATGVPAEEGAF
jgi:hypothetical protein